MPNTVPFQDVDPDEEIFRRDARGQRWVHGLRVWDEWLVPEMRMRLSETNPVAFAPSRQWFMKLPTGMFKIPEEWVRTAQATYSIVRRQFGFLKETIETAQIEPFSTRPHDWTYLAQQNLHRMDLAIAQGVRAREEGQTDAGGGQPLPPPQSLQAATTRRGRGMCIDRQAEVRCPRDCPCRQGEGARTG